MFQNTQNLFVLFFVVLISLTSAAYAQDSEPRLFYYGITLETLEDEDKFKRENLTAFTEFLKSANVPVTVRVVFQQATLPSVYEAKIKLLRQIAEREKRQIIIMGSLLDSKALAIYRWNTPNVNCEQNEAEKFTSRSFKSRVDCYVNDSLNKEVDIWEVGNEINGEWADEKCSPNGDGKNEKCKKNMPTRPDPQAVAQKIDYAIKRINEKNPAHKPIALTLIHQPDCFDVEEADMFNWLAKVTDVLKKIDYLLVSYYKDCDDGKNTICNKKYFEETHTKPRDCEFCENKLSGRESDLQLRQIYWNSLFACLHAKASVQNPNVRIGFGEVGCEKPGCNGNLKRLNTYYKIKPKTDWFIGGYFWWTAQEDLVNTRFRAALNMRLDCLAGKPSCRE